MRTPSPLRRRSAQGRQARLRLRRRPRGPRRPVGRPAPPVPGGRGGREGVDEGLPGLSLAHRRRPEGEGGWSWAEYTRNFESEPFYKILASESVCTGCHEKARTADWIFTRYDGPPPGG
ncbi:MAG: cytochrome P460 family protein [Deltaproteobacteria bacterium]|nr:cytochrome P460 family protein [Deltaproteobacteria bacterium]